MRLLHVRCPSCGAGLEPPSGQAQMTCGYCGAAVLLHRPKTPSEKAIPQVQVRPAAPLVVMMAALGAVGVATLVATLATVGGSSMPSLGALTTGPHNWMGQGPLLEVDVDGDGDLDIVSRGRQVGPDIVSLLAVDAADGSLLWESDDLGTYTDTYRGPLAWDGQQFLFADTLGAVWAIGPDGETRWRRTLGESVAAFCADGVAVSLAGGRIRLSGEAVEPTEDPCQPVANDDPEAWTGWSAHAWADYSGQDPPSDLSGMRARAMIPTGGDWILAGHRDPGTRVPTVARLRARDLVWKTEIPPSNPMASSEGEPDLLQVHDDAVYAVVERRSGAAPILMRLDAASGEPVWEAPLPDRLGTWVLTALNVAEGRVFVSTWGAIEVFDASTGAYVYRLGTAI